MIETAERKTVPFVLPLPKEGNIVEVLKEYVESCATGFCGRCMPCRYGTKEWDLLITCILAGQGEEKDLEKIETINQAMITTSLCPRGLRSPFFVRCALKYYGDDVKAVLENKTPKHSFKELPKHEISISLCDGCATVEGLSPCVSACPVKAVSGEKGQVHVIDPLKCYRCDACAEVCPKSAVVFQ